MLTEQRFGLPDTTVFDRYLQKWELVADGAVIKTHSSRLLPVWRKDRRLMVKVAIAKEEKQGNKLLADWSGGPFVQVLVREGDAVLMARADDQPSLVDMAGTPEDEDEATRIMCGVAGRIHKSSGPAEGLTPLKERFQDLWAAVSHRAFDEGRRCAEALLANPTDICPLHGDIHHGNILHFGDAGWLAIDPKGIIGERGFDYANMLCNPTPEIALKPGRLEKQLSVISDTAGIEPKRLAMWVVAWSALSAVWSMQSSDDPTSAFEINALAQSILRE